MELIKGNKYRFKHTAEENPEPIIYLGFNWSGNGYWHQFAKEGASKVWSELLDSDLHLIESFESKGLQDNIQRALEDFKDLTGDDTGHCLPIEPKDPDRFILPWSDPNASPFSDIDELTTACRVPGKTALTHSYTIGEMFYNYFKAFRTQKTLIRYRKKRGIKRNN